MRQCRGFSASAAHARTTALIRYRVRLADLDRHWFEIECRVENPADEQGLSLPAWIPGSYLLRDFARHVVHVEAKSGRETLAVEKTAAGQWCVRGAGQTLIFTITVYALDQSVRGAYLDRHRGYFNGPCVFVLPEGRDSEPVEVTLEPPPQSLCEDWRVATALAAQRSRRARLRHLSRAGLRRAARSSGRDQRLRERRVRRPAACRITSSLQAGSSRISSASRRTCNKSARRRSSSSASRRRSIAIGSWRSPSATATADSSIARRRASSSTATSCRRSARRVSRATISASSRSRATSTFTPGT